MHFHYIFLNLYCYIKIEQLKLNRHATKLTFIVTADMPLKRQTEIDVSPLKSLL